MLLSKQNIKLIIPQREPILMIDNLIEQFDLYTKTDFCILKNNIYVWDEVFLDSGIVENMAQTALAGMGWMNNLNHTPLGIGLLGSISNLKIYRHPLVEDKILTITEVKAIALDISLIDAKMYLENTLLAECELKIVYKQK